MLKMALPPYAEAELCGKSRSTFKHQYTRNRLDVPSISAKPVYVIKKVIFSLKNITSLRYF